MYDLSYFLFITVRHWKQWLGIKDEITATSLIFCCVSQIIVRTTASLKFCRPCASNRLPTATPSQSPSAAVMEAVAGDNSVSSAPCLALCSTKRCVHMGQVTLPMAEVRRHSKFYRVIHQGSITAMLSVT